MSEWIDSRDAEARVTEVDNLREIAKRANDVARFAIGEPWLWPDDYKDALKELRDALGKGGF